MIEDDYYNKISFGMFTCLFDRYTSNLNWFNIPLILYTMVLHTIRYFPFLAAHMIKMTVLAFVGFFAGAAVIMYLDYKYIFQSERQFQYNKMEYFEDHYNELKALLRMKQESVKNRHMVVGV